jgi:hypothetical protein
VADVALQQGLRPDAEAAGPIEDATTPRALVHQAIGGARIRQAVESRQRRLNVAWLCHRNWRHHNGG